eukprot:1160781-Pelagomonas_calceolata.AAC.6
MDMYKISNLQACRCSTHPHSSLCQLSHKQSCKQAESTQASRLLAGIQAGLQAGCISFEPSLASQPELERFEG